MLKDIKDPKNIIFKLNCIFIRVYKLISCIQDLMFNIHLYLKIVLKRIIKGLEKIKYNTFF